MHDPTAHGVNATMHMYTLIYSVWQLWRGSVVSLWRPPVCYEGIGHIPECIADFLLRLITPEELTKITSKYKTMHTKIHTTFFFFLNKASIHLLYNIHTSRMQNYSNTDSSLILETNYMSSSKWWLNVATHTQLSSVSLDQTWTSREKPPQHQTEFFLTLSSSLTQYTETQ